MQVAKNAVVTIDYSLKNTEGKVIDSSEGKQALPYLHGAGNLIPGLEKALEGKKAGDQLNVSIAPEEAYGQRNEQLVQQVSRTAFQGVPDIKVGMQFRTQGQGNEMRVVTVTRIEGDKVTVDANHPLAGIPLHFDISIRDVRSATKDELAHGHVHGPGGHHHH
jgi:FKBP-type peptidyl-prolyl cis-trans isomerase SlyD